MEWADRTKVEYQQAPRTWFGTLTLRPAAHVTMLSRARVHHARNWSSDPETGEITHDDFECLDVATQMRLHHDQAGIEITKYLKRLRKAGCQFRYLLVMEPHEGTRRQSHHVGKGQNEGMPHYHILIHEADLENPIPKSLLEAQWSLGHSQFRLVHDIRQAVYVTKYLSKSAVARVRASARYGVTMAKPSQPEGLLNATTTQKAMLSEVGETEESF